MNNKQTSLLATIVDLNKQILALDEDIKNFKRFRRQAKKRLTKALEELRAHDLENFD